MTVEDIFKQISAHMVTGLMIHSQLAEYFAFLGLPKYHCDQVKQYIEESKAYHSLCAYYTTNYNKLIPKVSVTNPDVISDSWYRYTRQDVDRNTKQNSVKNSFALWIEWEQKTKTLYEQMYKELVTIGEIAAANKVNTLIKDVTHELNRIQDYELQLCAVNYSLEYIVSAQ